MEWIPIVWLWRPCWQDKQAEVKETELIDDYIRAHIDGEHPYLHKIYRDSNLYLVHGHMISGHIQGTLLRMLVSLLKPRRILEIGTYTGYATLCMASALEDKASILTYEINDEMEDFTRPRIENSPWADKIDFRIGDVLRELSHPSAEEKAEMFDFVFLDGNKRQYVEYYQAVIPRLSAGGLIVADNTLWDGHVIDPAYDKDGQTTGIRDFNDMVAEDGRVEKVILPLRDGLTLIRKK